MDDVLQTALIEAVKQIPALTVLAILVYFFFKREQSRDELPKKLMELLTEMMKR